MDSRFRGNDGGGGFEALEFPKDENAPSRPQLIGLGRAESLIDPRLSVFQARNSSQAWACKRPGFARFCSSGIVNGESGIA
jgi:hypothetical protein